jgi:hypothetical protein
MRRPVLAAVSRKAAATDFQEITSSQYRETI